MIVRVTALTFISIVIVTASIFLLMKLETKQTLMSLMFEVVSASGTVGLSLGITPFLTIAGKAAIVIVMLIGRIGPLTLVLALGDRSKQKDGIEYPTGKTMIG
jgi:trk system potassium uptake protein TrkH